MIKARNTRPIMVGGQCQPTMTVVKVGGHFNVILTADKVELCVTGALIVGQLVQ